MTSLQDPYPIDMAFLPPCMTLSVIGLAAPGKIERGVRSEQCKNHLHQLHVCLPSKRGHTRLLYRMSLDFFPWLRRVPFIDRVWKAVGLGKEGGRLPTQPMVQYGPSTLLLVPPLPGAKAEGLGKEAGSEGGVC
jgi:hypothetical protein